MIIVPWLDGASDRASMLATSNPNGKLILPCVDLDSIGSPDLQDTVNLLKKIHQESQSAALIVRVSQLSHAQKFGQLSNKLFMLRVPVLLMADHDFPGLTGLSFAYLAGIIIENACITRTGYRRDYFRAAPLREVISHAVKKREQRPEFFLAFLDLWDICPHPAVVKRAAKLAQHFGAVLEHGPAAAGASETEACPTASTSVSGFEYLRRRETTEVRIHASHLALRAKTESLVGAQGVVHGKSSSVRAR